MIGTIFALFGAPRAIAARHTHTKKEHMLLLKWLRAGERRAPAAARQWICEARRVRRLMTFAADKPEDWRVSFRCFARASTSSARRNRERRPARAPAVHTRFHSAWPLAERAEAMLRPNARPR